MVKIYKWSNILNDVCIEHLDTSTNIKELVNFIIEKLSNSFQNDYYKYNSILIIRSGPPMLHKSKVSTTQLRPYYFDEAQFRYEQIGEVSIPRIVRKNVEALLNDRCDNITNIINNEYLIWTKIKKALKEFDVHFIEIKEMNEYDIINYINKKTIIETEPTQWPHKVISEVNLDYKSDSVFYYTIADIEKTIL